MPEKYIKVDYQDRILPGRLYRVETSLEVPLANLPNLDTMVTNFQSRLRSRLSVQSLDVQKGLVTEEKAELFIFISFGQTEVTKSLWTAWKTLEFQLSAIGSPKLINIDIQELPANLGQPEVGVIAQIQKFLDQWGVLVELVLLIVIIIILLEKKQ